MPFLQRYDWNWAQVIEPEKGKDGLLTKFGIQIWISPYKWLYLSQVQNFDEEEIIYINQEELPALIDALQQAQRFIEKREK